MANETLTLAPFFSSTRNPFNYAKVEQVQRDVVTGWLTLDEITQQLNLFEDTSQDDYLTSLELATRMAIEDILGVSLCSVQYKVWYQYPGTGLTTLYLDMPTTNVVTTTTLDQVGVYTADTTITDITTSCTYDPTGNRVIVNSIPNTVSQNIANPLFVKYTQSGSILASYPNVKQAGLMLLTHLYNNRSNSTEGRLAELPFGVAQLLRPYKPLVM